jgi:hypothetical protein
MADPTGIANWSVTHVDWSEGKWHPKVYRAVDTSFELLKNISVSSLLILIVYRGEQFTRLGFF